MCGHTRKDKIENDYVQTRKDLCSTNWGKDNRKLVKRVLKK